jgi:predicted nucleic acid-binding protein
MILVDSCVLIDIFDDDSQWKPWSLAQLDRALPTGLAVNLIVYSELAGSFASRQDLDRALERGRLQVEPIPLDAGFLAARAFEQYRHNKGGQKAVLPDFFIGAHAQVLGCAILTRDKRRFSTYFPTVSLITP